MQLFDNLLFRDPDESAQSHKHLYIYIESWYIMKNEPWYSSGSVTYAHKRFENDLFN